MCLLLSPNVDPEILENLVENVNKYQTVVKSQTRLRDLMFFLDVSESGV